MLRKTGPAQNNGHGCSPLGWGLLTGSGSHRQGGEMMFATFAAVFYRAGLDWILNPVTSQE
jgi:hypothetical protein